MMVLHGIGAGIATAFQHEDTARQVLLGLGAAAWCGTADATANLSLTVNQSALNTSLNHTARAEVADGINSSCNTTA